VEVARVSDPSTKKENRQSFPIGTVYMCSSKDLVFLSEDDKVQRVIFEGGVNGIFIYLLNRKTKCI